MRVFKKEPSNERTESHKQQELSHLQNLREDKSCRHLVVDDAVTNRDLIKLYLQGKGIQVDTAENGKSALSKVQDAGIHGYDVIWTDLKMEPLSGIDLTNELRKLGFKKYICVLTGNASLDDQRACQAAGVDLVCLKPIRKKELLELSVMQLY